MRADDADEKRRSARRLAITFVLLLVIGLCNKIFVKLMTFPLYNYPVFVNLISTFVYIPTSFSYILPMVWAGRISKAERQIPQSVFITMGALDSIAGTMQLFATNFIASGSLLILLQQASIPLSMLISRLTLDARYTRAQYAGALVVVVGLVVILLPTFSGSDGSTCHALQCNLILWSSVLVLSCVPMCLSTVYKERALAKVDIDPIYLNGFVSLYQFAISIPLSIPAAPLTGVPIAQVPQNAYDGWRCYLGTDSITAEMASALRPADACWPYAPIFATAYLLVNQAYNILIILMLKHGSASLLYLAMTLLVPLGNIAFALPFVPNAAPLTLLNFAGLLIIMTGLFAYRFLDKLLARGTRSPPDLTAQDHLQQARRAAVIVGSASGSFALEGVQYLIDDDMVLASPTFAKLERSPAQIRAGYLFKLGMRPIGAGSGRGSPLLDSAESSPEYARGRGLGVRAADKAPPAPFGSAADASSAFLVHTGEPPRRAAPARWGQLAEPGRERRTAGLPASRGGARAVQPLEVHSEEEGDDGRR